MLSACVRREDSGFGPEFDRMLLQIELEEPWLVDVGFCDSFVDPIVFHAAGTNRVNGPCCASFGTTKKFCPIQSAR
jgi:hypothetical protein